MYLTIVAVAIILISLGFLFVSSKRKEHTMRECSYGNVQAYEVLKNSNNYQLLKQRMSEASSFEERYLYTVSISRLFPMEVLERWVNDEPHSADALLCYGARLVQWSWNARGDGMEEQPSRVKWKIFFERLDKTRGVLLKSAGLMPTDPTPWAYLIMVSTWNSDDFDTREFNFNQAVERDPHNWAAHMHMIIALSQKWGGNNQEMLAFAEKASNDAPVGSDLPAILIKAYLENWKFLSVSEEKSGDADAFIKSDEIRTKAEEAYSRSLGATEHVETAVSIFARYNTSAWFWIVKDKSRLKQDLDKLGSNIEDIHWRWAGPEGNLSDARKFADL